MKKSSTNICINTVLVLIPLALSGCMNLSSDSITGSPTGTHDQGTVSLGVPVLGPLMAGSGKIRVA